MTLRIGESMNALRGFSLILLLLLVSACGEPQQQLSVDRAVSPNPQLMKIGEHRYLCASLPDRSVFRIIRFDLDSGKCIWLTEPGLNSFTIDYAPLPGHLFYVKKTSKGNLVNKLRVEGGQSTKIFREKRDIRGLTVSEDGSCIGFETQRPREPDGKFLLHIYNINSENTTTVTPSGTFAYWAAIGENHAIYVEWHISGTRIMKYSLHTKEEEVLWKDSSVLYYDVNVFSAEDPAYCVALKQSADYETMQIVRIALTTEEMETLYSGHWISDLNFGWNDSVLVFVEKESPGDSGRIQILDLNDGVTSPVTTLDDLKK